MKKIATKLFMPTSTCLLVLFCVGCNLDRRVEGSKEAVEKMKSMQIKRVTTPQVVTIVDDWGGRVVKQAQQILNNELAQTKDIQGVCQLQKLPKITALEKLYAVEITLLGVKDFQSPTLSSVEKEILDAYLYNAQNRLSQITNIQKLGDSVLIYDAPIPTDNIICQKCFAGNVTPFGVWHVKFHKNEVIRKVNAKSLSVSRK